MAMGILAIAIIGIIRWIKSDMVTASGRPALTRYPRWWVDVVFQFDGYVGVAVIGAWLMLVLSGRRQPVKHWLDYFGRAIGTAWVLLFVANCCSRLFRTIE